MTINRIQFQRGVSMLEFFLHYGSEGQCSLALKALRWPQGFTARAATPLSTMSLAMVRASCSSATPAGTRPL